MAELTTEQKRALALARARLRLQEGGQPKPPERSLGQTLLENVWGSGEVDTPGERLGATVNDMGKSAMSGIAKGGAALLDLPGQAFTGMGNFAVSGMEALGLPSEVGQGARDALAFGPMGTGNTAGGAMDAVSPQIRGYQPQTTAGEYAKTAGEFLPGGALAKAPLAFGVVPGLTSEFAGQMTEGMQFPENIPLIGGADVEPAARIAGAIAGPSIYNLGANVITPNPADPRRIAAADQLADEGVTLTAGQRTGNVALRNREEYLPRTQQILQDQGDEFTSAALRRIGVADGGAEPEVLKGALDRIGGTFDDLASRNSILPDPQLDQAAKGAMRSFADLTSAAPPQVLRDVMDRVDDAVRTGQPITGDMYQSLRSRLSKATTSSDSALREGSRAMLEALDDAMERSLSASGNVEDLARYGEVRKQYRDFLAIEKAATSAGEDTAIGVINPRQLRTATAGQGRREYATGGRELGDLARAGNAAMTTVPNSGTPDRLRAIINAMSAAPTTVAGLGLGHTLGGGNPAITAAATIAGLLAPAARNAFTGSAMGQAYLGNQVATGRAQTLSPQLAAILATLLGQGKEGYEQ
jgi:hypothetical protein